jgi:hypothetical protein
MFWSKTTLYFQLRQGFFVREVTRTQLLKFSLLPWKHLFREFHIISYFLHYLFHLRQAPAYSTQFPKFGIIPLVLAPFYQGLWGAKHHNDHRWAVYTKVRFHSTPHTLEQSLAPQQTRCVVGTAPYFKMDPSPRSPLHLDHISSMPLEICLGPDILLDRIHQIIIRI